jgi:hypothetical protein
MKFEFLNALLYFFYHKHRWSKASNLGPVSFEEHLKILGNKDIRITEDSVSKRIQWEDLSTMYVFKFSLSGEFQLIEREIWYEYKWPSLTKTVLMEVNRA